MNNLQHFLLRGMKRSCLLILKEILAAESGDDLCSYSWSGHVEAIVKCGGSASLDKKKPSGSFGERCLITRGSVMIYKLVYRRSNKLFSGETRWSRTRPSSALFLDPLWPLRCLLRRQYLPSFPRFPSTLEPDPILCKGRNSMKHWCWIWKKRD